MTKILSSWAFICRRATGQWGHVARSQLLAIDVPASTIDTWVARGRLISVHAGVYAVGYRRPEPEAAAMAAVLAGGPGAVLSHDSAAALWGLRRWPDRPEITSPRRCHRPGIAAHRSTTLTDEDVTEERGIATTSAARTLRDIRVRIKRRRRFERLVSQARLDHHLDSDAAFALLGHRHNPTRSGGERTFRRLCQREGLPEPGLNVSVCGYEVDALFPEHRLIVEIDHYATHGDPASFDDDRIRDGDLQAAGYLVVRLTEQRLLDQPRLEAVRLRRILRQRCPDSPADERPA